MVFELLIPCWERYLRFTKLSQRRLQIRYVIDVCTRVDARYYSCHYNGETMTFLKFYLLKEHVIEIGKI